jgi:hypothetical protein
MSPRETARSGPNNIALNSLDNAAGVSTAFRLESALELLRQVIKDEPLAEYKARLTAVQMIISEIAQHAKGIEQARLKVIAANASSASCDPDTLIANSDAVTVRPTVFNRLASQLTPGESCKRSDLISEWSQYQKTLDRAATSQAISRLQKRGVLEFVSPDTIRRSHKRMVFNSPIEAPAPLDSDGPQAVDSVSSLPRKLVAVSDIVSELLRRYLEPDFGGRVDRAFGTAPDDKMRLLVAVAAGVTLSKCCKMWSPPLDNAKVIRNVREVSGLPIRALRAAVQQELTPDFVQRLTSELSRLAYEEAVHRSPQSSTKIHSDAGSLVAELALSNQNNQEATNRACVAFNVHTDDLPAFVSTVLYSAREPLVRLLEQSPLTKLLGCAGVNKIEMISGYVLTDKGLKEVGGDVGLTGERARQICNRVEAIHPLVEAVMRASAPKPELPRIPQDLLTALTNELKKEPAKAYKIGVGIDANPQQLANEDQTSYFRRIFLAAFAGRYGDGKKTALYPEPLRHLPDRPGRFFKNVAYACIDTSMSARVEEFSRSLSDKKIDQILRSNRVNLQKLDLRNTRRYIRALVNQPWERRANILKEIKFDAATTIHSLFELVEPVVRQLGKERAEYVCAVFDQPWYTRRPLPPSLQNILSKRIREQLSVAETCGSLNITHGMYAMNMHNLILSFPTLGLLVPRVVHASRRR